MERFESTNDRRIRAALGRMNVRVTVLCDADGRIAWVSESVRRLLGHDPTSLIGRPVFDLYCDRDATHARAGFERAASDPKWASDPIGALARRARVRHRDGHLELVESLPTDLLTDPAVAGIVLEWTPVPDRAALTGAIDAIATRQPVAESIGRIVALLSGHLPATDIGVAIEIDGDWNGVAAPGDGPIDELIALMAPPSDPVWRSTFVVGDDRIARWAGSGRDVGFRPVHSAAGHLLATFVFVREGVERLRAVVTTADNTCDSAFRVAALALDDRRQRTGSIHAAELDSLTGLANRAGLARRFAELARRNEEALVLHLDLDDFGQINDEIGDRAGDQVLAEIGRRLTETLRDCDIAARIGGDEFVAICGARMVDDEATAVAVRVATALARPVAIELPDDTVMSLDVGISMGTTIGSTHDLDPLLAEADQSLYAAKLRRKARGRPG